MEASLGRLFLSALAQEQSQERTQSNYSLSGFYSCLGINLKFCTLTAKCVV